MIGMDHMLSPTTTSTTITTAAAATPTSNFFHYNKRLSHIQIQEK